MFKNSVRTTKKAPHFTVTKVNRLTLFKEIIAVYTENQMKHINTLCGQSVELLNVKVCGTYSYHWLLKVKLRMAWTVCVNVSVCFTLSFIFRSLMIRACY
jgi:hypothetical protein